MGDSHPESRETLEQLLQAVTNAETGQRGYLLTAQPSYLAPYKSALERYESRIDEIAQLTADNANQAPRVAKLKTWSMSN